LARGAIPGQALFRLLFFLSGDTALSGEPHPKVPDGAVTFLPPMTKTERIDLGLAILHAIRKPGASFEAEDIAAWCGCSALAIRNAEAKALANLRKGLKRVGVDKEDLAPRWESPESQRDIIYQPSP
jgi:hypothetical protein